MAASKRSNIWSNLWSGFLGFVFRPFFSKTFQNVDFSETSSVQPQIHKPVPKSTTPTVSSSYVSFSDALEKKAGSDFEEGKKEVRHDSQKYKKVDASRFDALVEDFRQGWKNFSFSNFKLSFHVGRKTAPQTSRSQKTAPVEAGSKQQNPTGYVSFPAPSGKKR